MLGLLLPIAVAALAGTAYVVVKRPKSGEMTPARQSILDQALQSTAEPDKLRALAQVFRDEGLPAQADLLDKRAKLRELPPDVKDARKATFRAGMASKDPAAVRNLANEFEKEGATGAAAALRTYAFSLDNPAAPISPGTPTVDGHGTGVIPEGVTAGSPEAQAAQAAMAAAQNLVMQQQAASGSSNDPTQSPEAAAAMAALLAQNQTANTIDSSDHPEADAAAGLAQGMINALTPSAAGTKISL